MGKEHYEQQQEAFLAKRGVPDKTGFAAFREFIYNRETGTVLGRTGLSWLEITIFYIIFYSCLAAFWAVSLALFVYTLKDDKPQWYGKGSIIGINPGVGYQPWLKEDPDSTLIHIRLHDPNSYNTYVDQLEKYVKKYDNTENTRVCTGSDSNKCNAPDDCNPDACRFNPDVFGPCAAGSGFGYAEGKPCVLLSLNRLIQWQPLAYPHGSEPAAIAGRYQAGSVTMSCRGENPVDNEHIGKVSYFPPKGLDGKFFPYRVMANYHQPMAMVKFDSLTHNIIIQIECLAYAYNIIHDTQERMGLIHFEVLVDDGGLYTSGGGSS